MTNSRFRELTPGTTVELIATRIELNYVPAAQGELTAVWWAQEYLPIAGGHEQIGNGGDRLTTRLSEYAATMLTVVDPVTQQEVTLSAAGWVVWAKQFFDHAYNLENPAPEPPEG